MKKTLLIIAIALLGVSNYSMAQLSLGIKGGVNLSTASIDLGGSAGSTIDGRTGYHFGIYSVIKLGPIGIQPEAFYSVQGADVTASGVTNAVEAGYLQVPVLVRLNFLKVLNVHAGPQFGFLLSEAIDDPNGVVEGVNTTNTSIAAGVGLDLPFGLMATVRYVKGLNDILEGVDVDSSKGDMVQISVGFTLLGK
ncbi:MAG: PorT family protein [Reichenbachiella sp.]